MPIARDQRAKLISFVTNATHSAENELAFVTHEISLATWCRVIGMTNQGHVQ